MSGFQAQKGFTHFVFANYKDCYILPSLVRLDLNGYLYYLLKQQGYEGVYFISGIDGDYSLRLYDGSSRELYLKHSKKGKGLLGIFGGEEDPSADEYDLPGAAECARRFTGMLKKSRNQAFVFHPDTLQEIFSRENRDLLEEFARTGHRYLEQNGNILVLLMPMSASSSQNLLTDPEGIFAPCGEQELCPEVGVLLRQEHSVKLYEQLAKDMGERLVCLSGFTYAQMELAAKYFYMVGKPDWSWQSRDVKDLAAFLYTWYASPTLQRETGAVLSENDTRQFDLLQRDLSNTTTWWRLQRCLEQLRQAAGGEDLKRYLQRQYQPEQKLPGICADSLLARKIKQIHISDSLYGSMPELGKGMIARFYDIAQEYQTPRSRPICAGLEKELMQCLSCLENAVNRGDTTTFERAVKALSYSLSRRFAYEEDERRVMKCQLTVLQLSEDVFDLDQLIREDGQRLSEFTASKKRMIRQIEEARKSGAGVHGGASAQEHALSVKMHEAVNLDRQIDNLARSRAVKMDRRAQCLDTLQNLELAAGNLGIGTAQNVDAVLMEAVQAVQKDVVASVQSEGKLQELGKTLGYVMQEAPGSDAADVEAEYERLLRNLQEEDPLELIN